MRGIAALSQSRGSSRIWSSIANSCILKSNSTTFSTTKMSSPSMDERPTKRARIEEGYNGLLNQLFDQGPPTERTVGITQYVDPALPPFSAIIKHRFTDFLVYEVAPDGQVVHLTDISCPPQEKPKNETNTHPRVSHDDLKTLDWTLEGFQELSNLMGADGFEQLQKLTADGVDKDAVASSKPVVSKEDRTKLHQLVRQHFGGLLLSNTRQVEDGQIIDIVWAKGNAHKNRMQLKAAPDQPPFIHFTLHKFNRETHDAIAQIARMSGTQARELGICGTKDKRGVTCQRVSLRRGRRSAYDFWNSLHGNSKKRGRSGGREAITGIQIGDLSYAKEPLDLGQLKGNRFVITLRDVKGVSLEDVDKAVRVLKDKGFINYYGLQRFGTSSIPTHAIGLALLHSDWEKAANLVLQARSGDDETTREARRLWTEDKNAEKALQLMPRYYVAERNVLTSYQKQQQDGRKLDHLAALTKIPKNLRMMYIHAYQSYLWNMVLSERIRQFGCDKPIIGDLVLVEKTTDQDAVSDTTTTTEEAGQVTTDLSSAELDKVIASAQANLPRVKVLASEEELEQYSIYDVVLPLPGFVVKHPEGQLGDFFKSMMRQDGLDPDNMIRKQPEYSMAGTYRKILVRPDDVSHQFIAYTDPNENLALTDQDKLQGKTLALDMFDPAVGATPGNYVALQLEFTLGTSCYATMALREILKNDTGAASQKEMTTAMLGASENQAEVVQDAPVVSDAATVGN